MWIIFVRKFCRKLMVQLIPFILAVLRCIRISRRDGGGMA
jgi:hypothetical protein